MWIAANHGEIGEGDLSAIEIRRRWRRRRGRLRLIDDPHLTEFTFDSKIWPLMRAQILDDEREAMRNPDYWRNPRADGSGGSRAVESGLD